MNERKEEKGFGVWNFPPLEGRGRMPKGGVSVENGLTTLPTVDMSGLFVQKCLALITVFTRQKAENKVQQTRDPGACLSVDIFEQVCTT